MGQEGVVRRHPPDMGVDVTQRMPGHPGMVQYCLKEEKEGEMVGV